MGLAVLKTTVGPEVVTEAAYLVGEAVVGWEDGTPVGISVLGEAVLGRKEDWKTDINSS